MFSLRSGNRVIDRSMKVGPPNSVRFWCCGLLPWALRVPRRSTWNSISTLTRENGSSGSLLSFYKAPITKMTTSALGRHIAWVRSWHQNDVSWFLVTLGPQGDSNSVWIDLVGSHSHWYRSTPMTHNHLWITLTLRLEYSTRVDV